MNIMGKRTCLWGSDCGGDGGKGRESVKGRGEKGLYSEYVSILIPRSIGVSGFWRDPEDPGFPGYSKTL